MVSRGATLTLLCWGAALPNPAAATVVTSSRDGKDVGQVTEGDAGPFAGRLRRAEARLAATRGRPEAVVPLAQVAAMIDDLPPSAVERVVRGVALASSTDPLVGAQAALLLAQLEDHRGDAAAARRRREALGLFTRYWAVGPFGEGRASFAQGFPPEAETFPPVLAARYPGREREVTWRKADGAVRAGALMLDAMLRPDTQAVAYVVAFVRSDVARAAALRLGSAGPIKVWMNGAPVLSRDVVRAAALDQDAVGVRLRRGWNRVLIKTVITDGAWRLYARVTDPQGRPLPVTNPDGVAPFQAVTASPGAGRRVAVRTLEALLRARATASTGEAAVVAWSDLGRYLAWARPTDRQAREEVAALELSLARRPTPDALEALGDVARDDDERRRVLERLLALVRDEEGGVARSQEALVLARLGDLARASNREAVAWDYWRQALQKDPACWPATVALASEELEAGLATRALLRVTALDAGARAVPRVQRQWARMLDGAERRDEADRVLATLESSRQADSELAHQLAARARARGDAPRATAAVRRAAELRPDLPSLTIEWARALEGNGEPDAALAVVNGLVSRMPDEPAAQAHLGKLLHRLGRREEAMGPLRTALALKPQDPELRRYADRVMAGATREADGQGEDLARRFAADARAFVPAGAEAAARAGELAADPAVVLLDRRIVRVHRNGLSETFAQRIVEIRTDRGAEDNKQFHVRYSPGVEEVEIRQARILRREPGGGVTTLQASERDDQDLSEPWYGLYYDNRAEVIQFEGLRAGDVLEVQYLVADVVAQNVMADYFGDLQFIAEGIPKRRWEYVLIGPKSRVFHVNTPGVVNLERATQQEGDDQLLRFAARDVAKIVAEPAMPGYAEVGPYLHVSTYASWADVGAWYWRLVAEQLVADEALRATAQKAAPARLSDQQKVNAVHELVVTGTRYVGLEFGIHGFKPYKVTQVLSRRFGDCKDKAALMVAMLREVGVEAEMVLLRTRAGGRVQSAPASLAVFDHAIVYVPGLDLYLDGTAEFSGPGELPHQDQGVMGLRVGARGATLIETPVLPSSHNRAARRWAVELTEDGAARIAERLVITGQAAPEWRQHYQTPGERLDRYAKVWSGRFPGANLIRVEMPGIEDRAQAVTIDAVAAVPKLGTVTGDGALELPITVREADYSRTYARLSERRQELVIAYPWQHEEEVTYRLPRGFRVRHLPAARVANSPFGRFRLELSAEAPGVVQVRSTLDITRHRLTPGEYGQFRRFLGDVDAALSDRIAVVRETP